MMRIKIDAFDDYGYYERECHVVANLLSVNEEFLSSLEKIRSEISLKNYVESPKKPSINRLTKLFLKLGKNEEKKLREFSRECVGKFDLPPDWEFSIKVLVITNTFYLPSDYSVIRLHVPPKWIGVGKNLNKHQKIKNGSKSNILPWKEVKQYPAIYFKGKVSIKTIKNWLDRYGKQLKKFTDKLPDVRKTKIRDKTIFWGDIVHRIIEQNPNDSWSKIVRKVEGFVDSYFDKDGNLTEDVDEEMREWLEEGVSYDDLNNYYSSYKEVANS